jgi:hypothetical protein
MAKSTLVAEIQKASSEFAMEIVKAIQGATFQEISALQAGTAAPKARRGRPPKAKGKPGRKPGRPAKAVSAVKVVKAPVKKKRVVKNYPKCAFPGCGKNRFVRGKGFCGKHWKLLEAGKIKDAASYKSAKSAKPAKAVKAAKAPKKGKKK